MSCSNQLPLWPFIPFLLVAAWAILYVPYNLVRYHWEELTDWRDW